MPISENRKYIVGAANHASISQVLGAASNDTVTLCTRYELINKWAKYKPESNESIRATSPREYTLEDRQANNFGLNVPTAYPTAEEAINDTTAWTINKIMLQVQTGLSPEYCNLGDFCHPNANTNANAIGYNHEAYAPIQGIMVNGDVYAYDDTGKFQLSLNSVTTSINLGVAARTSGDDVSLEDSTFITINDLKASSGGIDINQYYLCFVYTSPGINGTTNYQYVVADAPLSIQKTLQLKVGNIADSEIALSSMRYDCYLLGASKSTIDASTKFIQLPFQNIKNAQGTLSIEKEVPISVEWDKITFDRNNIYDIEGTTTIYSNENNARGSVYLIGTFTNKASTTDSLVLTSTAFKLAANPSLVSENSTGKRTATVYVQDGVGSWIPVSELSFAPNESKRLMVGVPNLLVMAQADNGILDSPSYPTATIPEKSIIFSLTYAGAEYNGEWTIGYNGKIGY